MKRLLNHPFLTVEALLILLAGSAAIISVLAQDESRSVLSSTAHAAIGEQCEAEDKISEEEDEVYFVSCGGFF